MTEPRVSFGRKILRPRLSLRALMLAILVIGGGLGWYMGSVRRQAQIVAEIRRHGGHVFHEIDLYDIPIKFLGLTLNQEADPYPLIFEIDIR